MSKNSGGASQANRRNRRLSLNAYSSIELGKYLRTDIATGRLTNLRQACPRIRTHLFLHDSVNLVRQLTNLTSLPALLTDLQRRCSHCFIERGFEAIAILGRLIFLIQSFQSPAPPKFCLARQKNFKRKQTKVSDISGILSTSVETPRYHEAPFVP